MDRMKNKVDIQEYNLEDVEATIKNKVLDFIYKYGKNPKYLKLPLWISCCMKREIKDIEHFNLDYNTEVLFYKDLLVCETISITKLEEIEVF